MKTRRCNPLGARPAGVCLLCRRRATRWRGQNNGLLLDNEPARRGLHQAKNEDLCFCAFACSFIAALTWIEPRKLYALPELASILPGLYLLTVTILLSISITGAAKTLSTGSSSRKITTAHVSAHGATVLQGRRNNPTTSPRLAKYSSRLASVVLRGIPLT